VRVASAPGGDHGGAVRVGAEYNRHFVDGLPPGVDPFGENGEFHTEVVFDN
jgi:diphthamide synthase (EF-2-diphthine--ammonia ligase)